MWNEIALEELDENTNKSTKFWLKVLQDWTLAREYDVDIEKYVSNFVMLIINKYNNSWCLEICQIGVAPADRPILAKFPNITRTINP
jgi:hypothetical protein